MSKDSSQLISEYTELAGYSIFLDGMAILQDDNTRIHRAQVMKEWFRERQIPFSHLDWSPQSLDLNSIENLFGCAGEGFVQWLDSTIINTRSWCKSNVTMDGNNSGDKATVNTVIIKVKDSPTK